MKVFKGGYKIVSLLNIDITSDFTIPGIYDDIKDSHGKPILVSEINVGGEKMNDAYTIVKQDNTDYIIEVYGYSLTIASDDSVTVASLPEITSIGSGLDLTDGELSATSTGGKLYRHIIRANGTSWELMINYISSKDSAFANLSSLIDDYYNNATVSTGNKDLVYLTGVSGYKGSGAEYLAVGIAHNSTTKYEIKFYSVTGKYVSSELVNYSDVPITTYIICEV